MSIMDSIPRDWLERLKNNEFDEEDLREFQELHEALDEARYCIADQIKALVKQRKNVLLDWSRKVSFGEREGDFPVSIGIEDGVVLAEWRNGDKFEFPFALFEQSSAQRRQYFLEESKARREQQDREIAELKAKEKADKERAELAEYNRLKAKFEDRSLLATKVGK